MHKVVRINESQVNRLFTIRESSGVNDVMFKVADLIARQISFNDVFEVLSDTSLIEDWHEEYDTTYDGDVEYEGEVYPYSIYYDAGGIGGYEHGNTDGDTISVNFYILERIIAEDNDMKRISDRSYSYDDDDDEFDANSYSEKALDDSVSKGYDFYMAVYPVVLHELTHNLNKDSDPMNRTWIKNTNRFNEEDVRDFMYMFSSSEINSRVASASAILINALRLEYSGMEREKVIDSGTENQFFMNELMPKVLKHHELKYDHMRTLVGLLENYNTHFPVSKEYLEDCLKTKSTAFVNSIFFHLAINEDKLYKRSNPRQVLRLYASDPRGFEEKVISFYQNLLEDYKRRIYKVCWYTFKNQSWESREVSDDYDKNVKPWRKKIWGWDWDEF